MAKAFGYQEARFSLESSTTIKKINHFRFPQKDPSDFLGIYLPNFSISINQPVASEDSHKLTQIRSELYQELLAKLNSGRIGNIRFVVQDYIDLKYKNREEPRRYLKIERRTNRNTPITIFFKAYVNGDNLYVSADAYILGRLSWKKFTINLIILYFLALPIFLSTFSYVLSFLLSLPLLLLGLMNPINFLPFALLLPIAPVLFYISGIYLYTTWFNILRGFCQNTPWRALRHVFGKGLDNNSFDIDDSFIFLKSILPLVTETIKEVFSKNGISIQSLEEILLGIERNITSQSINLTAIDSTFVGVNIGGFNNQAHGKD